MSRQLERARSLLQRPGAWLDQANGAYTLRLGGDRRSRVVLTLDEAAFRAVIERPGLKLRQGAAGCPARPTTTRPFRPRPAAPASSRGNGR
ncbi:hypothetical protein V8F63_08215 [Brevundimonas sp. LF-1]|uniref:hypothetical protein n=1 Tax=Brevundimonas sp. LF-1 TaxID=3126100 RepID=UPI0030DE5110